MEEGKERGAGEWGGESEGWMGGRGREYGCDRRKGRRTTGGQATGSGREEERMIHVHRPPSKRLEEASKAGLYCC